MALTAIFYVGLFIVLPRGIVDAALSHQLYDSSSSAANSNSPLENQNQNQNQNPSAGVEAFSSSVSRDLPNPTQDPVYVNPRPRFFGFLPVFPWPKQNQEVVVGDLFPPRAKNEYWRMAPIDHRLSTFPLPQGMTDGSKASGVIQSAGWRTGSYSTPTRVTATSTTTTTTTTTTTRPPTTTTTTPTTTTTRPSPTTTRPRLSHTTTTRKSVVYAKYQTGRRYQPPSMKSIMRGYKVSSGDGNNASLHFSPTDKEVNVNAILIQPSKCRPLDPLTDGSPHPETDWSCRQTSSGRQSACTCTYLVATRNHLGCATSYHTLCWRKKK